jgi:hypothetical protein
MNKEEIFIKKERQGTAEVDSLILKYASVPRPIASVVANINHSLFSHQTKVNDRPVELGDKFKGQIMEMHSGTFIELYKQAAVNPGSQERIDFLSFMKLASSSEGEYFTSKVDSFIDTMANFTGVGWAKEVGI